MLALLAAGYALLALSALDGGHAPGRASATLGLAARAQPESGTFNQLLAGRGARQSYKHKRTHAHAVKLYRNTQKSCAWHARCPVQPFGPSPHLHPMVAKHTHMHTHTHTHTLANKSASAGRP